MKVLIIFILLAIFSIPLYAQEETGEINDDEEQTEIAEEVPVERQYRLSPQERQRIEMEIKTSTLGELALWCRNLGLSEGGTREELSKRLREYHDMPEPSRQAASNQKILTIESAQTTEYFTIEIIDEDYARLRGDVSITLKDGDSIHTIKANEILFNRTRNILTARGGVEYEKADQNKTETFRGENITVNIDNWSSVFLDGSSTMENDGSVYLFSGQVISRTDQDVTILKKAQISSAGGDEPYWSISASKLWLLPGSDFVIANAVLKVGKIPVLYIPFFYFPTDQLIFHPVIGYRKREGGFVQTTTYILGQPKADPAQASSLSRIMGNSNDMQLVRDGLFLRSSGKKVVDPNEISLRALLDYYVNLGTYIGVELAVPKKGILDPLTLNLGVGFTRTVFNINGRNTPYSADADRSFEKNHSNLFSLEVPFRYKIKFKSSITGKLGTFAWDLPIYSDPFVDKDFLNRAESMDWVNMLQQGAATEDTETPDSRISHDNWTMSATLSKSLTALAPYISRMSLSSVTTTLSFKELEDSSINQFNPNRFFFAPANWTIVSLQGTIAGNPLSLGQSSNTASRTAGAAAEERRDPLFGIGVPISPWPSDSDSEAAKTPAASADMIIPPALRQTFTLPSKGRVRFSIDYNLTPSFSSELQFMNTLNKNNENRWKTYEDVDWAVQSIIGNFSLRGNVNFNMSHSSGVFSNTVSFTGNTTWRDYFFLNEEHFTDEDGNVDEERMEQVRRSQYSQTYYLTSYSYIGRVQPLIFSQVFKQSTLSYSFGGTLVRSKRWKEGESPEDGPELSPIWGIWEREDVGKEIYGLTTHQFGANLAANIMDKTQSLSFSYSLPPLDERISTSASFRFWISDTSISTSMDKLTDRSLTAALKEKGKAEGDWLFRPLAIRETLRFSSFSNLSFNITLDPEEKFEVTNISTNLKLWELDINFVANRIIRSEFKPTDPSNPHRGGKWEKDPAGERELLPQSLSLAYNKSFRNIEIVKDLIGFSFFANTSLRYNLQEYTSSVFNFSFGVTFKITNFLDIDLSASSTNNVIWRYFKNIKGMEKYTFMYDDGPQNNPFIDFFNSFHFGDTSKRERSGFKMGGFNINATHHLGDWTATLGIRMYSDKDVLEFPPKYKMFTDISFAVQWKPITEIKTNISFEGKTEKWKVE